MNNKYVGMLALCDNKRYSVKYCYLTELVREAGFDEILEVSPIGIGYLEDDVSDAETFQTMMEHQPSYAIEHPLIFRPIG
jgi:hypothetical protein